MDEMIYCLNSCPVATCLHHPGNIENPELPHKQAHLYRTDYCPIWKQEIEKVEVVRCAHCRNWYAYADKLFGCCRREYWDDDGQYRLNVETNHDDYCSYGERRDGD